MSRNSNSPEERTKTSRRKWMKALSATAGVGLAGCTGDGGNGTGNGSGGQSTTSQDGGSNGEPNVPQIEQTNVSFGHIPFLDHTNAILGIQNDWFSKVGITIQPPGSNGKQLETGNQYSVMISGGADIVSGNATGVMRGLGSNSSLVMLSYHDLFQGYHVIAQPDKGYKSYEEFQNEGMSSAEAIAAVAGQLTEGPIVREKGATVTQSFLNQVIAYNDSTSQQDLNIILQDNAQHIPTMESDRADFELGGAPYQLTLLNRGYKPLLNTGTLLEAVEPKRGSQPLLTVFKDGWVTTRDWFENNRPTALRMSAVNFKINEYITGQPMQAAEQHVPYLNEFGGTELTTEDGVTIYEEFDPFYTFEEQRSWFYNEDDPLYYEYHLGTWIDSYVEDGILEEGKWTPEDVSVANNVYYEMEDLKNNAESQMESAQSTISEAPSGGAKSQAQDLLSRAEEHHAIYNFYDSDRFSQAAVEWAEYA